MIPRRFGLNMISLDKRLEEVWMITFPARGKRGLPAQHASTRLDVRKVP